MSTESQTKRGCPQTGEVLGDYIVIEVLCEQPGEACALRLERRAQAGVLNAWLLPSLPRSRLSLRPMSLGSERLSHPHLLPFVELLCVREQLLLVTEPFDGPCLGRLLAQRGRLSETQATSWLAQLLAGLELAHRRGLAPVGIHPSAIFVLVQDLDGSPASARESLLLDPFAKLKRRSLPERWLAPEQREDGSPADPRSDIFACGLLFLLMLCGEAEFERVSTQDSEQAFGFDPTALRRILPTLSLRAERVLKRSLCSAPRHRFSSAEAMRTALVETEIVGFAADHPLPHRPALGLRVRSSTLLVGSLILLLATYAIWTWSWPQQPADSMPAKALLLLPPAWHSGASPLDEREKDLASIPTLGSSSPLVELVVAFGMDHPSHALPLLLPYEEWLERFGDNLRISFVAIATPRTQLQIRAMFAAEQQSQLLGFGRCLLLAAGVDELRAIDDCVSMLRLDPARFDTDFTTDHRHDRVERHARVQQELGLRAADITLNGRLLAHPDWPPQPERLLRAIDDELSAMETLLSNGSSPQEAMQARSNPGLGTPPPPFLGPSSPYWRFGSGAEPSARWPGVRDQAEPARSAALGEQPSPARSELDTAASARPSFGVFVDLAQPAARQAVLRLSDELAASNTLQMQLHPILGPRAQRSMSWAEALLCAANAEQRRAVLSNPARDAAPSESCAHFAFGRQVWDETWELVANIGPHVHPGEARSALLVAFSGRIFESDQVELVLAWLAVQIELGSLADSLGLAPSQQARLEERGLAPRKQLRPYAFRQVDGIEWLQWPRLGPREAPLVLAWTFDPSREENARVFEVLQRTRQLLGEQVQLVLVPSTTAHPLSLRDSHWRSLSEGQLERELALLFERWGPVRPFSEALWNSLSASRGSSVNTVLDPQGSNGAVFVARRSNEGLFGWSAPSDYPLMAYLEAAELLLGDGLLLPLAPKPRLEP